MSPKAKETSRKKSVVPKPLTEAELWAEMRKPPRGESIYEVADSFGLDATAIHRAIEGGRVSERDGLIRRGKHCRLDSMTFEYSVGRAWLTLERAVIALIEAGRYESDEAVYRSVSDFVARATDPRTGLGKAGYNPRSE